MTVEISSILHVHGRAAIQAEKYAYTEHDDGTKIQ